MRAIPPPAPVKTAGKPPLFPGAYKKLVRCCFPHQFPHNTQRRTAAQIRDGNDLQGGCCERAGGVLQSGGGAGPADAGVRRALQRGRRGRRLPRLRRRRTQRRLRAGQAVRVRVRGARLQHGQRLHAPRGQRRQHRAWRVPRRAARRARTGGELHGGLAARLPGARALRGRGVAPRRERAWRRRRVLRAQRLPARPAAAAAAGAGVRAAPAPALLGCQLSVCATAQRPLPRRPAPISPPDSFLHHRLITINSNVLCPMSGRAEHVI